MKVVNMVVNRDLASVSVVVRFYEALAEGDAEAIGTLVAEHFASDVVLRLPPGLPYGGIVLGAAKLESMFTAVAAAPPVLGPVGPRIIALAGDESVVFAEVRFDWAGTGDSGLRASSTATEKWVFNDGFVSEIVAYYWDPAACPAPVRAEATS
ncbi:nuclear transport factor 2 family protein [Rhodococcus koreensis]|uniref:nuclear transport factor 2 family protein n=1 Tax=Rhodococcus koreensis TaxID=99653 RepID=UPI00366B5233